MYLYARDFTNISEFYLTVTLAYVVLSIITTFFHLSLNEAPFNTFIQNKYHKKVMKWISLLVDGFKVTIKRNLSPQFGL